MSASGPGPGRLPGIGGALDLRQPKPPPLAAELFTKKDLEATGPGDSTDGFLTEDEDERPRGPRETGPEDRGALGAGQERVLKRRKVVLSPRVPARQRFPVAMGFSFRKNQILFFFYN